MTDIFDHKPRQLTIDGLLAEIEQEESEGFKPGAVVGHVDFTDFRAIVVQPGRAGRVLCRVIAGWQGEHVPTWPVSLPVSKLLEV